MLRPRFNPCRVFSGLATTWRSAGRPCRSRFQSLSGFFRPCNKARPSIRPMRTPSFNPCRVFSGLATLRSGRTSRGPVPVSIPVGFFQALQHLDDRLSPLVVAVSIPVGFFQALQQSILTRSCLTAWFQSLSGFFRPCNDREDVIHLELGPVSIPVGFFQALQLDHH